MTKAAPIAESGLCDSFPCLCCALLCRALPLLRSAALGLAFAVPRSAVLRLCCARLRQAVPCFAFAAPGCAVRCLCSAFALLSFAPRRGALAINYNSIKPSLAGIAPLT